MGRSNVSLVIYLIIGLAVLGLITTLMDRPLNFITTIFLAIGVAFVIYWILTAIVNRGRFGANEEMRKYRRAAKQSNLKYNKQKVTKLNQTPRPSPLKTKRRRRNVPHLTVIEGKKGTNNKDRASN